MVDWLHLVCVQFMLLLFVAWDVVHAFRFAAIALFSLLPLCCRIVLPIRLFCQWMPRLKNSATVVEYCEHLLSQSMGAVPLVSYPKQPGCGFGEAGGDQKRSSTSMGSCIVVTDGEVRRDMQHPCTPLLTRDE
jgi:hypothetical protein